MRQTSICLATWLADSSAEELPPANLGSTLLALDGEGGRDWGRAGGTTVPELAPTLRAGGRKLALALEEVALRVAACETECDPVTERLPTLLLDPVAFGLRHHRSL